jgi:hypothetical protein
VTSSDSINIDDNVRRDLYLFFELVCQRCGARWEPPGATEIPGQGEAWAEAFAAHFETVARAAGWGSVAGDVLCPSCLGTTA